MNVKMKTLCAFAALLACSPVFAGEKGVKQDTERAPQATPAKTVTAAPAKVKKTEPGKKALKDKATARKVTKEEVGKEAVCPVTGETFKITGETGSASYKDKIYYFCCSACDKPFLTNPEKYLAKKQAPAKKTYVCPMGDYQGDKPGKCPKCGMTLVEKK
jgi:YHS domain-containing protein